MMEQPTGEPKDVSPRTDSKQPPTALSEFKNLLDQRRNAPLSTPVPGNLRETILHPDFLNGEQKMKYAILMAAEMGKAGEEDIPTRLEELSEKYMSFLANKKAQQAPTLGELAAVDATVRTSKDTTQSEISPEIREAIIQGKGFEVIERIGWEAYRGALTKISYADMVRQKAFEVDKLEEKARTAPDPFTPEELAQKNYEASLKVQQLIKELPQRYPYSDPTLPFSSLLGESSKLTIQGKAMKQGDDIPHTRLYFTVYDHQAPDAFLSLFEELNAENAMNTIDLSLFVEESKKGLKPTARWERNNIILYLTDFTPETMEKIARAVNKAKEKQPDLWKLNPKDLAAATKANMYGLRVPLNETTGLIEMPTIHSFDAMTLHKMQKQLGILSGDREVPTELPTIASHLQSFSPDNPGAFSSIAAEMSLRNRRKYMPGLLFEEAKAA